MCEGVYLKQTCTASGDHTFVTRSLPSLILATSWCQFGMELPGWDMYYATIVVVLSLATL